MFWENASCKEGSETSLELEYVFRCRSSWGNLSANFSFSDQGEEELEEVCLHSANHKFLQKIDLRSRQVCWNCDNLQNVDFSRIVYSWSITLSKNRDGRRTRMIQINWWRRHRCNCIWNVMIQLIWSIKKNRFFISKQATSGTNAIRNSKRGRREQWRRMAPSTPKVCSTLI